MNAISAHGYEIDAGAVGDDVKMYSTVRIIAVPPGEAPLWVREKWVGLELPAVGYSAPRGFFAYGVLSSPRSMLAQWWGVIRGRAERISGYAVEAIPAVDILATSRPRPGGEKTHLM
jgi:hypothetical protein